MTSSEAQEHLLEELLWSFNDMEDDAMIPARDFMHGVGKLCGVPESTLDELLTNVPEWAPLSWWREKIREMRQNLAAARALGREAEESLRMPPGPPASW